MSRSPIAADRTWRLPWRRLDLKALQEAAAKVAAGYAGVTVTVEAEDTDTHTAFFKIPSPAELAAGLQLTPSEDAEALEPTVEVERAPAGELPADDATWQDDDWANAGDDDDDDDDDDAAGGVVELSLYDMDGDGVLLSLEADASDNGLLVDEADQIADELAEALRAEPLDL